MMTIMMIIEFFFKIVLFSFGLYFALDYIFISNIDNTTGYTLFFLNTLVVIAVFAFIKNNEPKSSASV